jgi:hypothetical protein
MVKHRNGSLEKAARLIVLRELRASGKLAGLSLQKIANLFPQPPDRSTIKRTMDDLDRLEIVLNEMLNGKEGKQ